MSLTKVSSGMIADQPAFSAKSTTNQTGYASGTVLAFDTKEFDTGTCFSTSTNRFTPNVAGYYFINANAYLRGAATAVSYADMQLKKNGTLLLSGPSAGIFSTAEAICGITMIVYMNGTTDYLEVAVNYGNGASQYINSGAYFQGFLARAA